MDAHDSAEISGEIMANAVHRGFNRLAATWVATMAALLAVAGLIGDNATDRMVANNILASDTWAFFQAKNVRQTMHQLALADLQDQLNQETAGSVRSQEMRERIAAYQATIARYDSEPDPDRPGDPTAGEGKREISARARMHEAARDLAHQQDENFDYASMLLELGLVLASVAILAQSRFLLFVSGGSGVASIVLIANGLYWLEPLPAWLSLGLPL